MLTYTLYMVALIDPIRSLLQQPILSGQMAKLIVKLSEFDLYFIPQRSIKGTVVFDFFTDLSLEDQEE